ncbi:MAG: hypothetical protein KJ737_11100 [Proteobacteria bacterium]|nr:hypothetical protein [Pseudomonadota bacterium]
MTIKKAIISVSVFCICVFPVITRAESRLDWVKLTPEFADSDRSDMAFGLKFDFNPKQKMIYENNMFSIGYTLKGEWASEEDINTEPVSAKVDISFDRLTVMTEGNIYYYANFQSGYASDDRFHEQELDGGLTLAASYKPSTTFKLDVLSHYSWVCSFESEHRDHLGGNDNDYFDRLELEALAVFRLRKLLHASIIKNLKFSANYRYFYQNHQERAVEASGENDFDYIKIDMAYEWWPSGIWGLVQEAFVSYSHGHLPTQTEDQCVWQAGIVLYGAE